MGNFKLDELRQQDDGPQILRLAVRRAARLAVLLVVCLGYAPVAADEPPAPEPVENCTLEKQKRSGEECLMCGASHGDPAKCLKRLAQRGYRRRCRGDGDSVWLEAWCRPLGGAAEQTATPAAAPGPLGY